MADAAATNVTVVRAWREGGVAGKDRVGQVVRLTGGTFGGTTNQIPAAAFGLTMIEAVSAIWIDDSEAKSYGAAPAYGGTHMRLFDLEQATDASRALPADVNLSSVTLEGEVKGY